MQKQGGKRYIMNQREQFKRIIKFMSSLTVIAMQMSLYWIVWLYHYNSNIELPFFRKGNWLMVALYGVLLFFFVHIYGGLKVGYLRKGEIIYSQILGLFCVNAITYIQICLLDRHFVNAGPLFIITVLQMAVIVLWASFFQWIYSKMFPPRKMILIYGERPAFGLMNKIRTRDDKYNICETVNVKKGMEYVASRIQDYDSVIIGDIPCQARNHILKYCFEHSIRTYILPKISDIMLRGADDINLFDSPLLLARNQGFTFEQKVMKRTMDIVLSLIGIVLSSPLMLLTALAILIQDGAPVIHKQTRLTMGGKEFCVYKFRSMKVDSEKTGAQLAKKDDDRITPVGHVIRALHIDELPQLFNILKGDMAFVGPRPERPEIAELYKKSIPEFNFRLKMKAGLTGYAQVFGKYSTTPYDKLKLDLTYIENYTFALDLMIIIQTVKILFQKENSEGVDGGQKTALRTEDKKN